MSNLQPYRIDAHFTTAADGADGASDLLDQLVARAEELGINFETAGVGRMDDGDVIADSPLDRQLRG